jgi:hypothetical protein
MVRAMKHLAAKASIIFGLGIAPLAIASCSSSSGTGFGTDTDSGGSSSDSGGKDGSSGSDGSSITDGGGGSETSTATNGIGMTCTPDPDGGQGTCDTGFVCLSLENGTNAWCSKTCTQAADTCATGYTGTGLPQCTIMVDTTSYCGVICQDEDDGGICSATVCTGSCPGTLACAGQLQNTSSQNVAKVCQ